MKVAEKYSTYCSNQQKTHNNFDGAPSVLKPCCTIAIKSTSPSRGNRHRSQIPIKSHLNPQGRCCSPKGSVCFPSFPNQLVRVMPHLDSCNVYLNRKAATRCLGTHECMQNPFAADIYVSAKDVKRVQMATCPCFLFERAYAPVDKKGFVEVFLFID